MFFQINGKRVEFERNMKARHERLKRGIFRWIVTDRPWAGGRALTHSGSNTMWYCTVWIAPARDFAVLVTTNQGGDEAAKACDEASWALIQDHIAHANGAPPR